MSREGEKSKASLQESTLGWELVGGWEWARVDVLTLGSGRAAPPALLPGGSAQPSKPGGSSALASSTAGRKPKRSLLLAQPWHSSGIAGEGIIK